jgi:hypothetical protein
MPLREGGPSDCVTVSNRTGPVSSFGTQIMLRKTALWTAGALGTVIALATLWPFEQRMNTIPTTLLEPWKRDPPEGYSGAATIWISCEKGDEFGSTTYPHHRCNDCKLSDLAPEPAIFAHCQPDEDFNYDVQSTKSEVAESNRRPEIGFVLTEAGPVRNAFITRSSGSRSLDQKVLGIVSGRKYTATNCGSCSVFVAPPVNLKKQTP